MTRGYYWYRLKGDDQRSPGPWGICEVGNGYVHFFGQVSQAIGNAYLTKYVEFGTMIEPPKEAYP